MKLTILLLTAGFLNVSARGFSQTVSYSGRNVPLEKVFNVIEQQTGYTFYYKVEILQQARKVDISLKNATLEQSLAMLFKDQPLTYNIVEKNIVVNSKRSSVVGTTETMTQSVPDIIITGRIASEENEPLQDVNVTIKGSSTGTTTDEQGLFKISIPDENAVLILSMVGFAQQEVKVGARTFLNVRMKVANRELNQVVVIGYGTVKKRDITGSVASLNFNNEVTGTSMTSLEQGMKGRMAGVLIKQTSYAPGGGISVLVRGASSISGSTEPLYVVDGFPLQGGNQTPRGEVSGPANEQFESSPAQNLLNFLSPEDIESIEVLKDASATAIYGSRGANGVVLITTKKSKNNKPSFTLSHYTEVASLQKKLDLLDGYEFAKMMNEQVINVNTLNGMAYEDILNSAALPFPGRINTGTGLYVPSPEDFKSGAYPSTDWQDQLYNTAVSSNTALSFSGGAGKTKYYFGGNYRKAEGMIVGSKLERFTLNANIQSQLYDKLSFSNNLILSGAFMDNIQEGVANFGVGRPVITRILQHPPTSSIGDVLEDISQGITALDDPYTMATKFIDKRQDYNVFESANIEFTVMKDLVLKVKGGVRFFYQLRDMYFPLSTDRGQMVHGQASNSSMTSYTLLNENTLTYNKKFGRHALNSVLGFTQEKSNMRSMYNSVNGFTNDLLSYYSMQAGTVYNAPLTNYSSLKLNSFLGRVNYALDDKYLLTFSMRADGSSKFGMNNKWGYFPSAAIGWKLSEEDFIKRLDFISNLKLRASYGFTGSQGIIPYQSLAQLGPLLGTLNGTTSAIGYQNVIIENPKLKWETTRQFDIGIDVSFIKDKLSFVADYYSRNTKDLLQQILLPGSTGYVFQQQNLGSIKNKGVELQMNAVLADKEFKWDISANYSKNINKITDLGDADMVPGRWVISYDFYPFKLKVGQSLGNIYGYQTNGILRNAQEVTDAAQQDNRSIGEFRYVDQNKDGAVVNDGSDEVLLGSTNPDFSFGFTTNFKYKRFDLSAIVYGSIGQEIVNMNLVYGSRMVGSWNAYRKVYQNAFRPEVKDASGNIVQAGNPDGEWNMAGSLGARTRNVLVDKWVEDASFVKLGNVTFGYTFPKAIRFIKKLRLYASASNVLTITPYKHGYDPEASMYGQDPTRRGVDFGVYPPGRTFKFGVDFTF
ncbi:MAG: TonB-dependent receptor [Bacteroidota bacterium]